ncbi:MAG: hypothetical protein R2568_03420 [Candidatus Scalindua sp.]|jgi:uncharacterized membrane protein|nr:hypothetical protein [Candidatus Scalindua sp.]MDV5165784.1 hypothetical protein [Candidatus Scalindua sp.]
MKIATKIISGLAAILVILSVLGVVVFNVSNMTITIVIISLIIGGLIATFITRAITKPTHSLVNAKTTVDKEDPLEQNRAWLDNSPVCTKVVDLDFNLIYMSAAGVEALKIDDVTKLYGETISF